MLETPHVIVGAAIATKVVHPALAIPLAFGSHFILEKVPHWNPHLNSETKKFGRPTKKTTLIVFADVMMSLALGLFIASQALPDLKRASVIIVCCFMAALPDIIEGPYFFLGLRSKFIKKWISFQKSLQADAPFALGVTTQVLTVGVALWWILT